MIDRIREMGIRYQGRLLALGIVLVLFWVAFLDSHSLYKRWTWQRELSELTEQNEMLLQEIARLRAALEEELTDEEVERLAREQYGMQRPGETVHPVESADR
jgi:cell division protein FtsB